MQKPNKSTSNGRKNFISINEGFVCENCSYSNPPQKGGCRNHCIECLYSKHVDANVPGDRESVCKGLMEPIEIDKDSKKGYIIVHKCIKCKKITKNKVANDDNFESIIKLSRQKHI